MSAMHPIEAAVPWPAQPNFGRGLRGLPTGEGRLKDQAAVSLAFLAGLKQLKPRLSYLRQR